MRTLELNSVNWKFFNFSKKKKNKQWTNQFRRIFNESNITGSIYSVRWILGWRWIIWRKFYDGCSIVFRCWIWFLKRRYIPFDYLYATAFLVYKNTYFLSIYCQAWIFGYYQQKRKYREGITWSEYLTRKMSHSPMIVVCMIEEFSITIAAERIWKKNDSLLHRRIGFIDWRRRPLFIWVFRCSLYFIRNVAINVMRLLSNNYLQQHQLMRRNKQ